MEVVIVHTTFPDAEDADRILRTVVEERLAGCAQRGQAAIHSVYPWEGSITAGEEWPAWIKTLPEQVEPLRERLEALHPYEVCEFLSARATASPAYGEWLRAWCAGGPA